MKAEVDALNDVCAARLHIKRPVVVIFAGLSVPISNEDGNNLGVRVASLVESSCSFDVIVWICCAQLLCERFVRKSDKGVHVNGVANGAFQHGLEVL